MSEFVNLKMFDKGDYLYNILIGERSNGKTFCVKERIIKDALEKGAEAVFLRRYDSDVMGGLGQRYFEDLVYNDICGNLVEKYSKGKYDGIKYYRRAWYFTKWDDKKEVQISAPTPFCYFLSLNTWERSKGNSFPKVNKIFFDEFISDKGYLQDEFYTAFLNTVSTVMRFKEGFKIYMAGNTISQYCPYFEEMGISRIGEMKKGDFDVVVGKSDECKIAIQFTDSPPKKKNVNKYFAFKNPKVDMITGENSAWAIGSHPHKPCDFGKEDIKFIFFIEFNRRLYQCEIVQVTDYDVFIFCHPKTTQLKLKNDNILFSPTSFVPDNRIFRNIFRCDLKVGKLIKRLIEQDKIFYSTNAVGENIITYFAQCRKNAI